MHLKFIFQLVKQLVSNLTVYCIEKACDRAGFISKQGLQNLEMDTINLDSSSRQLNDNCDNFFGRGTTVDLIAFDLLWKCELLVFILKF